MKTYLISGCCGLVGTNYTLYLLKKGVRVIGIDNLSRRGSEKNLAALQEAKKKNVAGGEFYFYNIDLSEEQEVVSSLRQFKAVDVVVHLAAQTAVTTSITNPRQDMKDNILATFNLLEWVRLYNPNATFLFNSTNKVYGHCDGHEIIEKNDRWEFENQNGINESQLLDGYSPYGVSKLTGDQYVRDYARIYGLKTVVFRCSCLAGCYQNGNVDNGWVSWFIQAAIKNSPLTIYGDGKQTRDVLFVGDLIEAYEQAILNIEKCKGQIYNMGGGYVNIISLKDLIGWLEEKLGYKLNLSFAEWRVGDQLTFIADTSKFEKDTDWQIKIFINQGLNELLEFYKK